MIMAKIHDRKHKKNLQTKDDDFKRIFINFYVLWYHKIQL